MKLIKFTILTFITVFILSCNKETNNISTSSGSNESNESALRLTAAPPFLENFETGTKGSYTTVNVTLTTGVWSFNDALLGNLSTDAKDGLQSARVRNSGKLTMKFDHATGAASVTIKHAKFGSDASTAWQLWYSTNGGTSYTEAGSTINTTTTTLQTASFTINVSGNIRFEIRKTDGSSNRMNFDDFSITDYSNTNNPVPALTSISPSSATAGGSTFTLTLNGSNFISGSVIKWNTASLTTTYVSSTKVTAAVPAADIATTGTDSVFVFNPTPGGGTSVAQIFTVNSATTGTKKFLFDATKAETAGNADWVIDEDGNVAGRYPTPAQSGITASTPETYWTGAISSWGIALVKAGNSVETLPVGVAITFGNPANPQDLSNYDVFVVDEPNIVFTASEKTAILNYINSGGGLFMISDHTQSDRNNDGWDSPAIWNDFMTNNGIVSNPFGFSIDLTNISQVSTNVLTNSTGNVILNGSQGSVTQMEFNNGATITTNSTANPNVQGLIWENTYAQNSTHVMCASSTYGSGRVFVVTDSSPIDDGTGAPGNNIFVSWSLYSHAHLFMNASLWLAKSQ